MENEDIREIYKGESVGLYTPETFGRFIESQGGRFFSTYQIGNKSKEYYLLGKSRVMLAYSRDQILPEKNTVVEIIGTSENIKNIENLILKEAKKYLF